MDSIILITTVKGNPDWDFKGLAHSPKRRYIMSVFEKNHTAFTKIGIIKEGAICEGRFKSEGYMDLVVETLPMLDRFNGQNSLAFSMAHYFEQNGDLCSDPEMVVFYYPELNMVEAYSFQQAIPPIYQEVFPEPGKVYPRLKRELNSFLSQWLRNLKSQGHKL
jgi:hypothetical protein